MGQKGSLKDFQTIKMLGEGVYGQVYLVRRKKDGKTFVMKKVKLASLKTKEKENALNQIRKLAFIDDQFIIKYKEAFFHTKSNNLCIIMEYADGGDLHKIIKGHIKTKDHIYEQKIWQALYQITKGLKSLHDKKILHKDLRSANVFVSKDGKYKLGDLNCSKILKNDLAHIQTGTPYYTSPQVLQGLPYDMKSDMWSLGCVIYEMAALQPPFKVQDIQGLYSGRYKKYPSYSKQLNQIISFKAQDLQGLYQKIKVGKYKELPSYSKQLNQIISLLLKVNPKDRPNAETLLKNQTLLKKCGFDEKIENEFEYCLDGDPIIKTMNNNIYRLSSIKDRIPKASYNQQNTKTEASRGKSISLERTNSACRVRYNKVINPSCSQKRLTPVISNKYNTNEQKKTVELPLILRKLSQDNNIRWSKIYNSKKIEEDEKTAELPLIQRKLSQDNKIRWSKIYNAEKFEEEVDIIKKVNKKYII